MKRLILLVGFGAILWAGLSLVAQTNTNRISGVSTYWNTNTNAVVIVLSGRYTHTTNNDGGMGYFLVAGSSSNQPMWFQLTSTNLVGGLNGSLIYGAVQDGISTNINYIAPGPVTNSLRITNGVLKAIGGPI